MDLLLTALPAVGVIALLFALLPQFAELERAGRRRERKLDAIIKHLGIGLSPSADLPPEILEHLKAGRKIQAIKAYRLHTGAGLKEAKEVIEETLANMAAK